MQEFIEAISQQLIEHWIKLITAAGFMLLGWYFGKRRESQKWRNRDFLDRLNVSLNTIEENELRIRTLLEAAGETVFLNKAATAQLKIYAAKTSPGKPIIPVPAADRWYYLNAVLNEISERFAEGLLWADNGLPVIKQKYLVCLTREAEGDVRTQKIRAMMIRKDLLQNLPREVPRLEKPHHRTRWQTLQVMAETFTRQPDDFLALEVAIPGVTGHNKQTLPTCTEIPAKPERDGSPRIEVLPAGP